ncbi:MAG: hypothetical protein JXR96_24600 [Deltaproteobacteria bacterium]|nr:hypothetical protein [Deltaproteobacteria bacterium]
MSERVFALAPAAGKGSELELVRAIVVAAAGKTFQVASAGQNGLPVVGADGKVLGLYIENGTCLSAGQAVFEDWEPPPEGVKLSLTAALRFGAMVGGWVEKDHAAFVFDFDVGLRYWRFGLLMRIGAAEHSGVQFFELDERGGDGIGVASGKPKELRLGLELQFALFAWKNFLFRLAAGGTFSWLHFDPNGMAAFSTDPGCNPMTDICDVCFRDPDIYLEDEQKIGLGPSFGLDVECWIYVLALDLGYRFIPGAISYHMSDTHAVTLGIRY